MSTYLGWDKEPKETIGIDQKETIRHELVYAFLREIGLQFRANRFERSWAKNEKMIDWIAIQGSKIYKAWQTVDAV